MSWRTSLLHPPGSPAQEGGEGGARGAAPPAAAPPPRRAGRGREDVAPGGDWGGGARRPVAIDRLEDADPGDQEGALGPGGRTCAQGPLALSSGGGGRGGGGG